MANSIPEREGKGRVLDSALLLKFSKFHLPPWLLKAPYFPVLNIDHCLYGLLVPNMRLKLRWKWLLEMLMINSVNHMKLLSNDCWNSPKLLGMLTISIGHAPTHPPRTYPIQVSLRQRRSPGMRSGEIYPPGANYLMLLSRFFIVATCTVSVPQDTRLFQQHSTAKRAHNVTRILIQKISAL